MPSFLRQLTITLFAGLCANLALAQGLDEPVRLRLALDPDGSVRLSADPVPNGPPSLRAPALPALGPGRTLQPRLAIDLSAPAAGSACVAPGVLPLRRFDDCDVMAYGGLPGAIGHGDVVLSLGDDHDYGVSLHYGLDWLDASTAPDDASWWSSLASLLPFRADRLPGWLGPAGIGGSSVDSRRGGLGTWLWLGRSLRLDLGYEHARGPALLIRPDVAPWVPISQDTLAIGLSYGRFQGGLIGRHLRSDSPLFGTGIDGERLDLGFSWRMPWNAAIEFGARNLIVRPRRDEGDEGEPERGDLRTPYLRYHQDL